MKPNWEAEGIFEKNAHRHHSFEYAVSLTITKGYLLEKVLKISIYIIGISFLNLTVQL